MGLTESNQSKAAGGWGPSKSRSTPHFPDGRPYQNRPRQAATLPARPTPDSGHPPLYNLPRTPVHDPGALGHEPRPPEGISHRRDGSSVAGRSPGHRPIAPRRSASADSVKRRSDPLLDSRTMKHIHQMKPAQRDMSTMSSSPRPTISPPSSPRQHHRQRPTAIYLADDQAAHLVRHREGRPRERGHSGRVHHGGTRRAQEDGRERSSCERRQKAIHVSTVTLTPQCPKDSRTPVDDQPRPTPRHQRRRKDGNKARARVEYSAAEGLHGDPYVCLHYGGTLNNGQRQQVTAWRTDHQEEKVSSSNTQLSQVVIRMNQVCSTTLDNYDAVNANVESVQVRRNVWFHANRTSDVSSDITGKNKTVNTAAINDHPLAGERETEMIRWPDVTNQVSSVYMRPEMHIAAVSCMKEGREVMYGGANPVVRQGRTSSFTSSTVDHGRSRDDTSGRNLEYARSRVAEGQGVATSERRAARHFSVYDDRRNYSKAPGRRKKSVLVPFASQKKEKERLALPPSTVPTQSAYATQTKDEPVLEPIKFKLLRTDDKKEEQRRDNVDVSADYVKDKRKFECSCQDADGESTTYSSSRSIQGEVQSGSSANVTLGQIEFDRSPAKSRTELKFGLRSHVEDYTVIEANDVAGQYYGCEDSDQERDDSVWSTRQEYQLVSPDTSRLTNLREEPLCRESVDNASSFCDKVDKDSTTDSPSCEVNSSLFAWSGGERVAGPSSSEVVEALDGSVDTLTTSSGESVTDEEVVKDSYPGTCDSSPQELPSRCVEESGSRAYREALRMLEEKYWADTVSGLPTAVPDTHQCLNKWTSLPRHLQCARGRSLDGDTAENTMKGFRNRFKSLDVGNFVLRLPLGNQPRLVDVLRGAVPRGEAPADQPQGMTQGEEELKPKEDHNWHSNEERVSHSDPLCDDVTLVSYSECGTSAWGPGPHEAHTNGCGNLIQDVKCDALGGDGLSGRESETPVSVTEGESHHLFHEDTDVPTIRKGDAGGVSDGKWSVSGEVGVGGRDEARRRGSDPGWNMNESTVVKRRGHCVGEAAHTWHPISGDLGARPRSTLLLQDTTQATTDGTLAREEDFSKLSRPVGRHVRKRSHGRVVRPSLHTIAWDTPVATAPTSPDCSYTCHEQCQDLVTLDCKADLTPDSHTSQEDLCIDSTVKLELEDSGTHEEEVLEEEEVSSHEELEEKHEEETQEKEQKDESSRKYEEVSTLRKTVNRLQSHLVDNETLEAWVERYNATAQGLQISKESDGSFRGCIRVHLNLSRPINIVAGTRPPSIYDILQEDRTMEKTLTSFYMPRDAVKAIHVTSKTTTREVIVALLRKFKVVDNPQKFALYERTYDTAQSVKAKLRRLGDLECPLVLALNWSAGGLTNKRLVLQENDTADIQWEAFSLPELSNFLRILDREEEEYRCQIQDKYALLRRRIGNILFPNQQGSKD
ncbi:uncharacterized protein [Panulirus ornatus]|uniref:uncharacterized protein n=1 Tax=Panulirus ornatus TaxID=150431 RepID=UPI003A85E4F3